MRARTPITRCILVLLFAGAMLFLAARHGNYGRAQETANGNGSEANSGQQDSGRQIEAKNQEIKRLEEEAKKYKGALDEIDRATDTLQSQIQLLNLTIKQLDANIRITNAKISKTNLEIKELGREITGKETSIGEQRGHLGYLVKALMESDQETPMEILAKNDTLSSFFTSVDNILGVQRNIHSVLAELRKTREELQDRKSKAEGKRLELAALVDELADQKSLQVEQRRNLSNLLAETKNQERRYQNLLAEVEKKRDALQQEINALESGLTATFDRSALPAAGSGVIGWPLPDPIFITQYFGRTAFARAGGYNGKGHNGIDLRARDGTPVFASGEGRVRAVGDTDTACRRASYGRWILIDHSNNLTTLYAHLSIIKVRPGDALNRGELIGYSGRTGYATGPHLHLSLFAAQAVNVGQLKSRVCGRMMTLPLAPFGGYLNPVDYL